MNAANPQTQPKPPAAWSGPLMVCALLLMSITMGVVAVALILGDGKEGNREIPRAYEASVKEARDSRRGEPQK